MVNTRLEFKKMGFFILGLLRLATIAVASPTHRTIPANVAASCGLSLDQAGSFLIPTFTYPIEVAIDPAFSTGQREHLLSAISEWNRFGMAQFGKKLFSIREDLRFANKQASTQLHSAGDYCSGGISGSAGQGIMILRDDSSAHWEALGLTENVPAITYRCGYGDGKKAGATLWILVQTATGQSLDPLPVWALHELGHAMGLDHSCDGANSGRSNWRACNGLGLKHPYRVAVMYPYSPVGNPDAVFFETQERSRLGFNDEIRARCLLNGKIDH